MDSGGCGLFVTVLFQRRGLRVVPFVVHPSVCCHFTWNDSWRERLAQRARHSKRRGVGRAVIHYSERWCSHLSAYDEQARRENVQPLGQLQTYTCADTQNIPQVTVVRCLPIFSEQELANKITHDQHRMCLWPKVRICVSQICVVIP